MTPPGCWLPGHWRPSASRARSPPPPRRWDARRSSPPGRRGPRGASARPQPAARRCCSRPRRSRATVALGWMVLLRQMANLAKALHDAHAARGDLQRAQEIERAVRGELQEVRATLSARPPACAPRSTPRRCAPRRPPAEGSCRCGRARRRCRARRPSRPAKPPVTRPPDRDRDQPTAAPSAERAERSAGRLRCRARGRVQRPRSRRMSRRRLLAVERRARGPRRGASATASRAGSAWLVSASRWLSTTSSSTPASAQRHRGALAPLRRCRTPAPRRARRVGCADDRGGLEPLGALAGRSAVSAAAGGVARRPARDRGRSAR